METFKKRKGMFFFINEFVNVSFITFIIGTVGLIKIQTVGSVVKISLILINPTVPILNVINDTFTNSLIKKGLFSF